MSYTAWSVVYGEQPTAAKWNQLGGNDAEFNSLIQRNGTGLNLLDSNGNELAKGVAVASAVNEVTVNNAATGNDVIVEATGSDSNIHIRVRGKGNGLLKCSVLRQDNTTNAYKHNSVILTGWGAMTFGSSVALISETVTFGITFADRPIVLISAGGDQVSGAIAYGNGGNSVHGLMTCKCYNVAVGSFVAHVGQSQGSTYSSGNIVYYHWIAIGEL